jgi:hypothetical protein
MAYFKDSYKTTRDGGVEYTYDGNWEVHGRVVSWSARVRRADAGPQVVDGTINLANEVGDWTPAVKQYVERSIEDKVGVK